MDIGQLFRAPWNSPGLPIRAVPISIGVANVHVVAVVFASKVVTHLVRRCVAGDRQGLANVNDGEATLTVVAAVEAG